MSPQRKSRFHRPAVGPALALAMACAVALRPTLPADAAETKAGNNAGYDSPTPGSYSLPVIKAAADGALLDAAGHPIQLSALTRDRVTVMSFIYTRCAAARACPYATGVLKTLHRESSLDPQLAGVLRLVSLSFDPIHDTPDRMAEYARLAEAHPKAAPWHFVTTRSPADLNPILDAYGQAVDRKRNPADPTGPLNHTLRVFLIDAAGRIRNIYSSSTLDPRLVLADIRTLAAELQAPAHPAKSHLNP